MPSSCLRSARGFCLLLPVLALGLLAACSKPPAITTTQTLLLGAKQFATIASVETVIEVNDDLRLAATPDTAALRRYGARSVGRYRYHLKGPDGGVYKVHVLVFTNEAAALKDWQTRHRPEALAQTQPLPLRSPGEAWIYPNPANGEIAGLRVGAAVFEINARGAATQLADFVQAQAQQMTRVMPR